MENSKLIIGTEKCLFVLDLLLCSIWGLFMFSTWGGHLRALTVPLLLVAMRLWVSFLVYKHIGYGLYSSIGVAVILLLYENRDYVIALPIIKMVDYAYMIFCGTAPKMFYACYYYTPEKDTCHLIAYLGYTWLVVYPVLFGLYSLLKIRTFRFRPCSKVLWNQSDRITGQGGLLS